MRFGVYQTKSWYNHTPQGEHTILFPIGESELNTNPNLVQNPGYSFHIVFSLIWYLGSVKSISLLIGPFTL
ncbi:RagB/SusD family nutrient uptake outer membrane protein [uncultured Draconibacterium sp.]|uniref:RagB/SusD family nutrient uptake outer membrane protein n=1 Tax=uncultured Draconibacterium sp. TaxID=1573823 RepID=UPI00374A4B03